MALAKPMLLAACYAVTFAGLRFVFTVLCGRTLDLSTFGRYAFTAWIVEMSFLVMSFGGAAVASRFLAAGQHDDRYIGVFIRKWYPFAVLFAILAGVVASAASHAFADIHGVIEYALVAIWSLTFAFLALQTAVLTGLSRFDLLLTGALVGGAAQIVSLLLLSTSSPTLSSAICAAILGNAVTFAFGLHFTYRKAAAGRVETGSRESAKTVDALRQSGEKDIRDYALNMWVTALLASIVWSRGEVPLLQYFVGAEAVGRYVMALTLYAGAVTVITIIGTGAAPRITHLISTGADIDALGVARRISDIQLVVVSVMLCFIALFGHEVAVLVFGRAASGIEEVLFLLLFGLGAFSVSSYNHYVQVKSNGTVTRNAMAASAVFLFGASAILIVCFGTHGAAIARASTLAMVSAAIFFYVVRYCREARISWTNIAWAHAIPSVTFGAVLMIDDLSVGLRSAAFAAALFLIRSLIVHDNGRPVADETIRRLCGMIMSSYGRKHGHSQ